MNPEALGRWLLFSVYRGTLTFMTFTPVSGVSLSLLPHEGSPGDQHLAGESNVGSLTWLLNNTTGETKHKKNEAWPGAIHGQPAWPCKVNHDCICAFIGIVFSQSRVTAEQNQHLRHKPTANCHHNFIRLSGDLDTCRGLGCYAPQLAALLALSAGSSLFEQWTRLFLSASLC